MQAPDAWLEIPAGEREQRAVLTGEKCVIDMQRFFLKGNVRIPIVDGGSPFDWTVWFELSEDDFARAEDQWTMSGREADPVYGGRISSLLPVYPSTTDLRVTVHTQAVGVRPLLEVQDARHPLGIEQRRGITMRRVAEIAETILHGYA